MDFAVTNRPIVNFAVVFREAESSVDVLPSGQWNCLDPGQLLAVRD